MRISSAALVFAAFAIAPLAIASAGAPKNNSELAASLSGISGECNAKALDFSIIESKDRNQRELDRLLNKQKIQNDVQLYAIGHGHQQTEEHMIDLMQQQAQQDISEARQDAARYADESTQIIACVQSAENAGKETYAAFKKAHRKKEMSDEASSLMTAWLVNLKTVSVAFPNGSNDTRTPWQDAKTHAEIGAL